MNYRIFIFSITLCFISISSNEKPNRLTNQDIANHAYFWANKYVPLLNQEELTLLANLFYFNAKAIEDQIRVGNTILFAYVHAGMINSLTLVNEDEAKKVALASAVALRKLKDEYLPSREVTQKIVKYCIKELKKSEFAQLDEIMNDFSEYGRAIIAQFTKQDIQSIEANLRECYTTCNNHIPVLQQNNDVLSTIIEHKGLSVDTKNPELETLQQAIQTAENATSILADMMNKEIRIKRMLFDIMNINKLISQMFYQNMLAITEKEKGGPLLIMFNEDGIIAPEDRWQDLPHLIEK